MKRLIWIVLALSIYFLGSAIYIPAKASIAQLLLNNAWNEALTNKHPAKPWPWADTYPIARLRVSAHGIDQIVLYGDQGNSLAFGPGLHPASDINSDTGMIVISAHRDTHFNFLQDIKPGEMISLKTMHRGVSHYRVIDSKVVDISHTRIQAIDNNQWLTLVTCYPFNTIHSDQSLRYVVMAEAIDY